MARTMIATALILVCIVVPARAAVTDHKVFAESLAVQLRDGVEEERVHQSRGFPSTEQQTPVEAVARIQDENSSGIPLWSGFSRVLSNDPQYNDALPTDFIIESAAGSAQSNVSLQLRSRARQTRTVNVLASEFPTFSSDAQLNLQSMFLLDGGLGAVVPVTAGSAAGLEMDLTLELSKDEQQLWSGGVTVMGQEDGSVTTATKGQLHANDFTVVPLDVPGLANVLMVIFEDSPLFYEYQAGIGDTFELSAELTVDISVPEGLGAGAAFGTVPSELILLTEQLFGAAGLELPAAAAPEPATLILLAGGGVLAFRRLR